LIHPYRSNRTRRDKPVWFFAAVCFYAFSSCFRGTPFHSTDEGLGLAHLNECSVWEESVFGGKDPLSGTATVVFTGDLMLGGNALPVIQKNGADYPFRQVAPLFQWADIGVSNLEAPVATEGRAFEKTYTFRVPPSLLEGPIQAGIGVFTLGNNHIMDFGDQGLFSTLSVLDALNVRHCGAGGNREEAEAPAIVQLHGLKIGFLAFSYTFPDEFWAGERTPGTAYGRPDRMKKNIEALKQKVDRVVVSFHWGEERSTMVKTYQHDAAHAVIDWGADLVVGHHPHVLQGLEWYKGKLIAYSLGNFVFGSYSPDARESALLKILFDRSGYEARLIPISVFNYEVQFQPLLLSGSRKTALIAHLNAISGDLNGSQLLEASGRVIPSVSP
jgi:poly-gamma-glutamate capsule biosynthesis protein CapA/YwtB (metallophosphatase superfamily)